MVYFYFVFFFPPILNSLFKAALAQLTTSLVLSKIVHLCRLTCCHFAYDIALSRLGDSMFLVLKLSGRMGTLEECGQACLYLAAEATFTTGTDLLLTGGAELTYGKKTQVENA